jgi:glucose/arabinose dehydrogenase
MIRLSLHRIMLMGSALVALLPTACALSAGQPSQPADPCSVRFPTTVPQIELQQFSLVGFTRPVYVTHAGDGSGRLFVVEQAGVIRIVREGKISATPFLDIRDRVESGGEKGLLSVAFHPKYKENGRFFVNYTARKQGVLKSIIAEYNVSQTNPDIADRAERVILEIEQPFANHNGGLNKFGPRRVSLYRDGRRRRRGRPVQFRPELRIALGEVLAH